MTETDHSKTVKKLRGMSDEELMSTLRNIERFYSDVNYRKRAELHLRKQTRNKDHLVDRALNATEALYGLIKEEAVRRSLIISH